MKGTIDAKWPLDEGNASFPMAPYKTNRWLFIGCREPAKLFVLDTDNGKTAASVGIIPSATLKIASLKICDRSITGLETGRGLTRRSHPILHFGPCGVGTRAER
jgi:hypothetical protein